MAGWLGLPQAAILASPAMGQQQNVAPAQSFTWGAGGAMLTPEDLARQREISDARMQADYSPIASPWQGLARVSDNILGALQSRKLDKASQASASHSDAILKALLNPGVEGQPDPIIAALTSPNVRPEVRDLAKMQWQVKNRQPSSIPVEQDNAGNRWERQPDGKFKLVFIDKAPKQFMNGDQLVTIPNPFLNAQVGLITGGPGEQAAAPSAGPPPPEAIAELRSDPSGAAEFNEIFGPGAAERILGTGGPTQPASGGF